MENKDYSEELKNINNIMDSSIAAMGISKDAISNIITPDLMSSMSATQSAMIKKSKELLNMDLSDPKKIIDIQKELAQLLEASAIEANREAEKSQKESKIK